MTADSAASIDADRIARCRRRAEAMGSESLRDCFERAGDEYLHFERIPQWERLESLADFC